MLIVEAIAAFLERFAPARLAEEWDNVGLLVGDRRGEVQRIMTCLTVTPASAAEAIQQRADLVVSHHPLPFRPLKRLTADTTSGRLLLELIAARIAVYSPHTALDSARGGINQRWATGLGLRGIAPLVPHPEGQGAGRWGWLEEPLALGQLAERVKQFLAIEHLQMVGDPQQLVRVVAVACGAAGEFLEAARQCACDCLIVGETSFHTCLEAEAAGIGLLLPGHFASERFAVEHLAEVLAQQFPSLHVWASRQERDPVRWISCDEGPGVVIAKARISLHEQYDSIIPVAVPDLGEVREFAGKLHAQGQPWKGEAFGWPAEYHPERPEPPLDSKMTFTPADFCVGESGVWFFSLMWEHGKDAPPVEFLDDRNILA